MIHGGKKRLAFSDGRTIEVAIPKGAADGQTLRLKGQGQGGRGGQREGQGGSESGAVVVHSGVHR